jgi:hypothetical protein
MKRNLIVLPLMLFVLHLSAQTSELFPRYTVVDTPPQVTGEKSLGQLQREYQEQANKNLV